EEGAYSGHKLRFRCTILHYWVVFTVSRGYRTCEGLAPCKSIITPRILSVQKGADRSHFRQESSLRRSILRLAAITRPNEPLRHPGVESIQCRVRERYFDLVTKLSQAFCCQLLAVSRTAGNIK